MKIFQKSFYSDISGNVTATWRGLQSLGEAVALVVVSVYTAHGVMSSTTSPWLRRVLLVAASIIGLRGAYEFVRYLAQQGKAVAVSSKS